MKKLFQKKNLFIILSVILVGCILPIILNISLSHRNLIKTNISNEAWLNFWGTYLGGIFAIIIGYLAITHSNRNSEKAIKKQSHLLLEQYKKERLDEYNKCLRNNLEIFNIADAISVTISIDYEHLSISKAEIARKKSLIFSYDLQYSYVFEVESKINKTEIEKQYNSCWIESHSLLSNLLDMQLKLIVRISQHKAESQIKQNNQEILSIIQHHIESGANKEDINKYNAQITETKKGLNALNTSLQTYKNDVDTITQEINRLMNLLLVKRTELLDLSKFLMKEKEKELMALS